MLLMLMLLMLMLLMLNINMLNINMPMLIHVLIMLTLAYLLFTGS